MPLRFGIVAAMLCAALALPACGRSDDPGLARATPTPGAITRPPADLRLEFRGELRDGDASIQINRGGGRAVPVRLRVLDDRRTVIATPVEPLRAGTYQVYWRVTPQEGRMSNGVYDLFVIG